MITSKIDRPILVTRRRHSTTIERVTSFILENDSVAIKHCLSPHPLPNFQSIFYYTIVQYKKQHHLGTNQKKAHIGPSFALCAREDSNLHGIAPNTTSRYRVYQLRHSRIKISPLLCLIETFFQLKMPHRLRCGIQNIIYSLVSATSSTSSTSTGVSISTPLVTCSRSSSSSFGDFLRTIPRIRRRISLAALSRIK